MALSIFGKGREAAAPQRKASAASAPAIVVEQVARTAGGAR